MSVLGNVQPHCARRRVGHPHYRIWCGAVHHWSGHLRKGGLLLTHHCFLEVVIHQWSWNGDVSPAEVVVSDFTAGGGDVT